MNSIPLLTVLALESLGVRYRERECIVCRNKFLQRMKINNQGNKELRVYRIERKEEE